MTTPVVLKSRCFRLMLAFFSTLVSISLLGIPNGESFNALVDLHLSLS